MLAIQSCLIFAGFVFSMIALTAALRPIKRTTPFGV
ncbi:hypothetical protein DSM3645_13041 [Blastopirellula marina DSM 3645]|uniref:Uncharacterized protein n=1 Tax=Blastopirellula marina DSM 3645 TaxID=314230 RepID=A3ZS24_9BACT|nr:hypothetical protein DSM3645_13041 [Blastopirellula marina DSM 3645]